MIMFMQPLAFIASLHEFEFQLDSGTFGFLILSWVMNDGGGSYSKTLLLS